MHGCLEYGNTIDFMCMINSGVIQGCPMASLLFVLAMEPFVVLFNRRIELQHLGLIRLCADDIAKMNDIPRTP